MSQFRDHRFILLTLLASCFWGCNTGGSKRPVPNDSSQYQTRDPQLHDPYRTGSALISSTTANRQPLYVAIGGWNSCASDSRIASQPNPWGMNMNKGFARLMEQVHQHTGIEPHFIIACHSVDTTLARYVLSTDPGNLRIKPHTYLYQDITATARELNAPVVLLGHSYGGSFVMHAGLELPQWLSIAQLITIDGISPVYCPAHVMVNLLATRFGQITGLTDDTDNIGLGCQQSPQEFSVEQRRSIRQRVGWWQNYYQNDLLSVLKADAIPEACNTPVHHKSIGTLINGHIAMGMYDKLWADITNRLISPQPSSCLLQIL